MRERNVIRDRFVPQRLFAGPFVDAPGTWAGSAEIRRMVMCLDIIRPVDRQLTVGLFDYLNRLDHNN